MQGGGVSSVTPMVKLRHVRGGNPPAALEVTPTPTDHPEAGAADSHDRALNPVPSTPTVQPSPHGAAPDDAPAEDGAVFDPVVAAAFTARPFEPYSGIPRTKSDEQCKAELGTRRGPHQPSHPESDASPQPTPPRRRIAPPYMPSKSAIQAQMGVGLVALADEIARLEKQGRRYFAQKQPTAGRQMMAEAGRLKDALLRRSQ